MSRFASVLDLPPALREQAERKLNVRTVKGRDTEDGADEEERIERKNKYNAKKVTVEIAGAKVTFDSKHEYEEYLKLALREKAGEITDLETHVKFGLCDPGEQCRGRFFASYKADFVYKENGKTKVADAKSAVTRARRDWKRTKQLMKAVWGHDVIEL